MHTKLPKYLNFTRIADKGGEIQGKWPISELPRLKELLVNDAGEVEVEMKLGRQGKFRYVTGTIAGMLAVTCQRCMQPMDLPLNTEFKLALVQTEEQADQLPDEFEPLLADEDKISVPDLLEEEMLLAIPLVALHDTDCSDYLLEQKKWQAENESVQEKKNPFSVLKDLI
ncbi:MAG: YceD family protein [Gammaproteobacteria bacterium]|nr:YceD family protein [Gammaproteobacteria bacterium]MDH5735737.1 YceD family protein [Gammaproteobacteria bacterium]